MERGGRRGILGFAIGLVALGGLVGSGLALAKSDADTLGKSTVQQRIVPSADTGFRSLSLGAGEPYATREEGIGTAEPGRVHRRTSLAYFGQLSDFQLADEESPARVEFIDTGPFSAAWRPSEVLNPQIDDESIRQVNAFAASSPIADGDGSHRAMDFTLDTGDSADSQQRNEVEWVRTLLEGGPLNPGSGVNPVTSSDPTCQLPAVLGLMADAAHPEHYTGVQDYNDYAEGPAPQFYDPDTPTSAYASWPQYPGLMDKAQQTFDAAGLAVPSYVAFGNHDGLVQGNAAANSAFEAVATGCVKPLSPAVVDPGSLSEALSKLSPSGLLSLLSTDPTKLAIVPPDPKRQYVSKQQYKSIFEGGTQADGHGFGLVDPAEEAASHGAAGYYAWNPVPGMRFIALDTVSEAGVIGPSADGNIDDPQFKWLKGQLDDATAKDQLVVLFSHHAIPSLTANVPDEDAPPCTANDSHGHDVNPGCDLDPRDSTPIHLSADVTSLLHQYPHVVAWVAGHSHVNSIEPYPAPDGKGGFWSIRVAAEADWPQQSRLMELFDNHDGTLSMFGTILDHASDSSPPASGTSASGMSETQLASIGRELAYNDTQAGARACTPDPCGEGKPKDRNVELLIRDPRTGSAYQEGKGCKAHRQRGTSGPDRLRGTRKRDGISGRGGRDRVTGGRSRDCLKGGKGADRVNGGRGGDSIRGGRGRDRLAGSGGRDRIFGNRGNDRVKGGKGRDRLSGGKGRDRLLARGGGRDVVRCGPGRDVAIVDRRDRVRGCERVRRAR